jgi:anti-anti-sigma factor
MRIKTMRSLAIDTKLATFEPVGYLTAANVGELQDQLTEAVKSPRYARFLVDMSKVEFLDSAGLMAFVSTYRLASSLGKEFSICSIPPSVRIIFELTQLDKVLRIFENRRDFEQIGEKQLAA